MSNVYLYSVHSEHQAPKPVNWLTISIRTMMTTFAHHIIENFFSGKSSADLYTSCLWLNNKKYFYIRYWSTSINSATSFSIVLDPRLTVLLKHFLCIYDTVVCTSLWWMWITSFFIDTHIMILSIFFKLCTGVIFDDHTTLRIGLSIGWSRKKHCIIYLASLHYAIQRADNSTVYSKFL